MSCFDCSAGSGPCERCAKDSIIAAMEAAAKELRLDLSDANAAASIHADEHRKQRRRAARWKRAAKKHKANAGYWVDGYELVMADRDRLLADRDALAQRLEEMTKERDNARWAVGMWREKNDEQRARADKLEAELNEIALATGYGERPEGQSGVHRASGEYIAARFKTLEAERDSALRGQSRFGETAMEQTRRADRAEQQAAATAAQAAQLREALVTVSTSPSVGKDGYAVALVAANRALGRNDRLTEEIAAALTPPAAEPAPPPQPAPPPKKDEEVCERCNYSRSATVVCKCGEVASGRVILTRAQVEQVRERIGFPALSEAQQQANLEHNMGALCAALQEANVTLKLDPTKLQQMKPVVLSRAQFEQVRDALEPIRWLALDIMQREHLDQITNRVREQVLPILDAALGTGGK